MIIMIVSGKACPANIAVGREMRRETPMRLDAP
jgi:hypothetical protein